MSDQIPPPKYNSEWHLQPQAAYPAQPTSYDGPQQPAPYQQPYTAYPQQQQPAYPGYPQQQQAYPAYPQQQMMAPPYPPVNPYPQPVNININNVQNGYSYQPIFDPYRSKATTALTMGIIAVLIWIIPFVGGLTSLICAIIGIITGIQGRKSTTRSGSAITGMILSIVALIFMVGGLLIFGLSILSILFSAGAAGSMH